MLRGKLFQLYKKVACLNMYVLILFVLMWHLLLNKYLVIFQTRIWNFVVVKFIN